MVDDTLTEGDHMYIITTESEQLYQSCRLRIAKVRRSAKSSHKQGAPNPMESDRDTKHPPRISTLRSMGKY